MTESSTSDNVLSIPLPQHVQREFLYGSGVGTLEASTPEQHASLPALLLMFGATLNFARRFASLVAKARRAR
jgi:hypothetical protein